MGLFDGIFNKKECDICGGEIGVLGNKKLEDGNMCKKCAKKLSPWFDDRRHSTIEQIKEQLAYREENKAKVAEFNTTRRFGEWTKLLLDEDAGVFMVTSSVEADDIAEENPDVIACADVTSCELDVDEDRDEITYRDKEGNEKSYVPKRYRYSYNFYVKLYVNNPYFDDIRFKLNRNSVEVETGATRTGVTGVSNTIINPKNSAEYRKYNNMGEELKETIMSLRKNAREQKNAVAEEQKMPVETQKAAELPANCPACGAPVESAGKFCEFCGRALV